MLKLCEDEAAKFPPNRCRWFTYSLVKRMKSGWGTIHTLVTTHCIAANLKRRWLGGFPMNGNMSTCAHNKRLYSSAEYVPNPPPRPFKVRTELQSRHRHEFFGFGDHAITTEACAIYGTTVSSSRNFPAFVRRYCWSFKLRLNARWQHCACCQTQTTVSFKKRGQTQQIDGSY